MWNIFSDSDHFSQEVRGREKELKRLRKRVGERVVESETEKDEAK